MYLLNDPWSIFSFSTNTIFSNPRQEVECGIMFSHLLFFPIQVYFLDMIIRGLVRVPTYVSKYLHIYYMLHIQYLLLVAFAPQVILLNYTLLNRFGCDHSKLVIKHTTEQIVALREVQTFLCPNCTSWQLFIQELNERELGNV